MSDAQNTLEKKRCKYPGCGAILHKGHDGDYCYAHEKSVMAQEEHRVKNEVSDTDADNEFLSVEQVATILPYSERTIRGMLQNGQIAGTRFGIRGKWLITRSNVKRFQEHGERSFDVEQMADADKETFRKSDRIMAETDLIHLLSCLEHDKFYKLDDYRKLFKFMHYFYYESNSYINPELQRLRSKLWKVLEDLAVFLKVEFIEEKGTGPFRTVIYRIPGYGEYDDERAVKERSRTERELKDHVSAARRTYGQYRRAIKRILCL